MFIDHSQSLLIDVSKGGLYRENYSYSLPYPPQLKGYAIRVQKAHVLLIAACLTIVAIHSGLALHSRPVDAKHPETIYAKPQAVYGRWNDAQAASLKSKAQLSQYRNLMGLPDDLWIQADEEGWPERRIREMLGTPLDNGLPS